MIFGRTTKEIYQDLLAKEEKRKQWHKVFVIWKDLDDGRTALLQHVERKSYYDDYLGIWVNKYREIK